MGRTSDQKPDIRFLTLSAACIAFVVLLVAVILPNLRLSRAGKLIEAGDYEAAYALVKGMDYRNSEEIAARCLFPMQKAGLADAAVGSTIRFGTCEQDNDLSNGPEEIEWIVLAVEENKALVVSKYGLEAREFNDERNIYKVVTWSNSQLRTWLNETFYSAVFSADHREMILLSEVAADRNPDSDVNPGPNTKDHVFLLSIPEANRYFDSDSARKCWPTEYCQTAKMEQGEDGSCYWWLRSPGMVESCPSVVIARGSVFTNGFSSGHKPELAVRPAMWIELGGV